MQISFKKRYAPFPAERLEAISKVLEAAGAYSQAAARLTHAMTRTARPEIFNLLSQGLLAILADPVELEARKRAAVVACIGLGPQAVLATLSAMRDDLRPVPSRCSSPELVEMLKHPLCVGQARRIILDRLEDRYQQRFFDQWDFVRFAEKNKLGLDFRTPPGRPEMPAR
jgi:hypothetical protein